MIYEIRFKTKILTLFVIGFIGLFIVQKSAYAQMGGAMMQDGVTGQTLQTAVSTLLQKYKVSSIQNLDCNKVTNPDFEKFGDVVMGAMAGNEQSHSAMEKRMGGEGSQTLKNAHIKMGQRYLGCANGMRGGVGHMMGYGYGRGMMGGGYNPWSLLGLVTWLALLSFLITGTVFFWKQIKNQKKK